MTSNSMLDRRRFLRQGSLAGASVATGASAAQAQQHNFSKPIRVGCLNVVEYSHLNGIWAPFMNPRSDQKEQMPLTGMRITHCWEIERDKSEAFAKKYDCEPVRNFDDMVGKVDAVISGGYYNHPWNHILHEPYLKAGIPNLINRPFSNSRGKARQIIDLAKKHGAAILCPSAHEHTEAITRARKWAQDKEVICYSATNSFDDYPTHGIHGVYMCCRAICEAGNPVVSVAYQAKSWHNPPGVVIFEHKDAGGRTFYGTLHEVSGSWGTMRIHTREAYGGEGFPIRTGVEYPFNRTAAWAPTIWAFQQMALHREMPQSFDQIEHKNDVFLAGFRSILENEGKPVKLDDVPEDWTTPVDLPNRPTEHTADLFREAFGEA